MYRIRKRPSKSMDIGHINHIISFNNYIRHVISMICQIRPEERSLMCGKNYSQTNAISYSTWYQHLKWKRNFKKKEILKQEAHGSHCSTNQWTQMIWSYFNFVNVFPLFRNYLPLDKGCFVRGFLFFFFFFFLNKIDSVDF